MANDENFFIWLDAGGSVGAGRLCRTEYSFAHGDKFAAAGYCDSAAYTLCNKCARSHSDLGRRGRAR